MYINIGASNDSERLWTKKNTATYPCDYAGIECEDNGLLWCHGSLVDDSVLSELFHECRSLTSSLEGKVHRCSCGRRGTCPPSAIGSLTALFQLLASLSVSVCTFPLRLAFIGKMEATCSIETLLWICQYTRYRVPADRIVIAIVCSFRSQDKQSASGVY